MVSRTFVIDAIGASSMKSSLWPPMSRICCECVMQVLSVELLVMQTWLREAEWQLCFWKL